MGAWAPSCPLPGPPLTGATLGHHCMNLGLSIRIWQHWIESWMYIETHYVWGFYSPEFCYSIGNLFLLFHMSLMGLLRSNRNGAAIDAMLEYSLCGAFSWHFIAPLALTFPKPIKGQVLVLSSFYLLLYKSCRSSMSTSI